MPQGEQLPRPWRMKLKPRHWLRPAQRCRPIDLRGPIATVASAGKGVMTKHDVIVVGSGAGGAAASPQLARLAVRVLLLEKA